MEVAQRPVDGNDQPPKICIIELGGTVGDIEGMPFVEAFRQFHFKIGVIIASGLIKYKTSSTK